MRQNKLLHKGRCYTADRVQLLLAGVSGPGQSRAEVSPKDLVLKYPLRHFPFNKLIDKRYNHIHLVNY